MTNSDYEFIFRPKYKLSYFLNLLLAIITFSTIYVFLIIESESALELFSGWFGLFLYWNALLFTPYVIFALTYFHFLGKPLEIQFENDSFEIRYRFHKKIFRYEDVLDVGIDKIKLAKRVILDCSTDHMKNGDILMYVFTDQLVKEGKISENRIYGKLANDQHSFNYAQNCSSFIALIILLATAAYKTIQGIDSDKLTILDAHEFILLLLFFLFFRYVAKLSYRDSLNEDKANNDT